MAGGGKRCTASSAYDTVAKPSILFTTRSYAEPVEKAFITTGYSPRRGSTGHKPAMIRITADYLKTVGEGPDGELTFYSSAQHQALSNGCEECISQRLHQWRHLCWATPSFEDDKKPNHVYKLKKALYGLKQAPRAWYERLRNFLLSKGFIMGKVDSTLFTKKISKDLFVLQIYCGWHHIWINQSRLLWRVQEDDG